MRATKAPPRSPPIENAPRLAARGGSTRIRHFNGTTRRTSDWDGLRRDSHLWSDDADCLVYFYTHKASQRGASLRVPLAAVESLKCAYLTEQCLRKNEPSDSRERDQTDRKYVQIRSESALEQATYALYIPSPSGYSKQQAFAYHITTRNLIAFSMGVPLVGERLSIALVSLWKRFQDWHMPRPVTEFTTYLEKQGYLDFTESTEHSLACLKLAEDARLRDIWIDSFVHCVGMHERLDLSPEFATLNKTTAALIMRASLEMDLHIGRVVKAVGTFLEDELSVVHVGLPKATRDHLDLFRSFLHGFYVNRFGYFPPRMITPWNKRPWASMCNDFESLYNYLADTDSSPDWTNNRATSGGFCLVQNVQSFDVRHGYPSLPHPLPLIPKKLAKAKPSAKGLRHIGFSRSNSKLEKSLVQDDIYSIASNSLKIKTPHCALVQEYQRFERELETSKPRLDIAEARKVRWLLIYSVLQMLNSVIRAPAQVKDTETPSYPLCVLTSGCPPWKEDAIIPADTTKPTSEKQSSTDKFLSAENTRPPLPHARSSSRISIHPDCEADSAEDFFATRNLAREDSSLSLSSMTAPLKRNSSIRNSMHSSVQALQKSMVGSLTRRNSSRRASLQPDVATKLSTSSFCEIVVEHYDDGRQWNGELPPAPQAQPITLPSTNAADPIAAFDFGFTAEPTLEHYHLEDDPSSFSPADSDESDATGPSSSSNRSSYLASSEDMETPRTELSSWDVGSCRRDSDTSLSSTAGGSSIHVEPLLLLPKKLGLSYEPTNPYAGKRGGGGGGVYGGVYVPKGMAVPAKGMGVPAVILNGGRGRWGSVDSAASGAPSSEYPDEAVQAGDIEEVDGEAVLVGNGKRRLEGLVQYGLVLGKGNVW